MTRAVLCPQTMHWPLLREMGSTAWLILFASLRSVARHLIRRTCGKVVMLECQTCAANLVGTLRGTTLAYVITLHFSRGLCPLAYGTAPLRAGRERIQKEISACRLVLAKLLRETGPTDGKFSHVMLVRIAELPMRLSPRALRCRLLCPMRMRVLCTRTSWQIFSHLCPSQLRA